MCFSSLAKGNVESLAYPTKSSKYNDLDQFIFEYGNIISGTWLKLFGSKSFQIATTPQMTRLRAINLKLLSSYT